MQVLFDVSERERTVVIIRSHRYYYYIGARSKPNLEFCSLNNMHFENIVISLCESISQFELYNYTRFKVCEK